MTIPVRRARQGLAAIQANRDLAVKADILVSLVTQERQDREARAEQVALRVSLGLLAQAQAALAALQGPQERLEQVERQVLVANRVSVAYRDIQA